MFFRMKILICSKPAVIDKFNLLADSLVQHVDKIRVFKNMLDLTGGQQILHVLRQAARYAAPFPEPFPDFHAETPGLSFQK